MSDVTPPLFPIIFEDAYNAYMAQEGGKVSIHGHDNLSRQQAVAVIALRVAVAALSIVILYAAAEKVVDPFLPLAAASLISMPGCVLGGSLGGIGHNAFQATKSLTRIESLSIAVDHAVKMFLFYCLAQSHADFDMVKLGEEFLIQRLE